MAVAFRRLVLGLLIIVTSQVFAANTEKCDRQNRACPREEFRMFGINGWIIIAGAILLIIFIIAFTIFFIVVERRGRENLLVDEANISTYIVQPQTRFERLRLAYKEFIFRLARKIGLFSTEYPYFVITLALVVMFFLTRRVKDIQISTDPIEIWSSSDSKAFEEKQYFENNFKRLPRETRVILSYDGKPLQPSGDVNELSYILSHNILSEVLQLQSKIQNIQVLDNTDNTYVTLADVCVTPLGPETKQCKVRSVLNYWQDSQERLDVKTTDKEGTPFDYRDHFQACVSDPSLMKDGTPLNQSCRGPLENTVLPDEVLGGYTDSNFDDATALFIYIPLLDYSKDDPRLTKTLLWEKAFLNFITNYTIETLKISFSAKRSLTDEEVKVDKKSTKLTILVSYIVMFVYMVFAIGQDQASSNIKVKARIIISLTGILIILASVVSAFGVACSWGYVITPIAMQVVPFLALSVGGSNIFLILQKFSALRPLKKEDSEHGDYLANILALCAPSITAATISQAIAFYLASLMTDTPAIKTFAICASLSVVFNFILQLTIFISLLELEYRHRDRRFQVSMYLDLMQYDVTEQKVLPPLEEKRLSLQVTPTNGDSLFVHRGIRAKLEEEVGEDTPPPEEEPVKDGKIYEFFSKFYAPLLTSPGARYIVFYIVDLVNLNSYSPTDAQHILHNARFMATFEVGLVFGNWQYLILATAISCYVNLSVMGYIDVGLAEQNAVPKDSYLQKYYSDWNAYSRIGPEVYFVVKSGYNYTTAEGQNKICSEHQCQLNSLTAQLKNASMYSARTRIAHPATSWLDDYLEWLGPHSFPVCCRRYNATKDKFCPPEVQNSSCIPCLSKNGTNLTSSRSTPDEMDELLSEFLSQAPSTACPLGGKLLSDSVSLQTDGSIGATYFATYFTTLIDPADYIDAYVKANTISKQIEDVLNTFTESTQKFEVFPYSEFFVYYSQYDNLVVHSVKSLSVTFCIMFLTKGLLLGLSFTVVPLITGAVILFTINLMALLFFLDIPFSEIALVNIIIGIGIAGELFTHIADNFSSQIPSEATTRLIRTKETVSNTGSTVFTGDVLPKLVSFIGLFFMKNELIQSNFINVYLGMIGLLFFYGLVFVPVLMSFIGPVLQPTPTEVMLTRSLPLDNPEDTELTPIVPGNDAPGSASADGNGQPISGQ